jgi:hypothetical protein
VWPVSLPRKRAGKATLHRPLRSLCVVTVLRTPTGSKTFVAFRCSCSAFLQDAQCVHEGSCRVLQADPLLPAHTLKNFTAKVPPDAMPKSAQPDGCGRPVYSHGLRLGLPRGPAGQSGAAKQETSELGVLDTPPRRRQAWMTSTVRILRLAIVISS